MHAASDTTAAGAAWNRARYSAYAPIYDLVAAPFAVGRRRSLELLALQPGERVLVIGCGTGLDLPLLPPDVQVTAFDLTPAMVERTRARAIELGRAVDAAVMNGQQVALADGAFDAVVLHLILAVIPDPAAAPGRPRRDLRQVAAGRSATVIGPSCAQCGNQPGILRYQPPAWPDPDGGGPPAGPS